MNVLLIAAASSVHVMRWANAYAAQGHEVHLLSQHAAAVGYEASVHIHRLPFKGGAGYALNGLAVRKLVRRIAPNVVNAHYASGYGTLARWCGDTPVVLNVWGSDVFEFADTSAVHRALLIANLRSASHLVSTSEFMADRVRALDDRLPPLDVIPFGVDTSRFKPRRPEDRSKGLTLGTVKALAPKYGIDTLLKAFALAVREPGTEAMRLRIVGEGPQRNELLRSAGRLGIAERTDFVGAVPNHQVPDELGRMDVFVALSRADSETFGVAVVEAGAAGLPVVVSDAGGLPEVVEDGVTGFVVRRNDAEQAAERIGELMASVSLRRRMGNAGRERVEERYDWTKCVSRMLALLEKVAEQRVRS